MKISIIIAILGKLDVLYDLEMIFSELWGKNEKLNINI